MKALFPDCSPKLMFYGSVIEKVGRALGDHGEKVWLQETTQGLLEHLGLTALPYLESAEPPGWPALTSHLPRKASAAHHQVVALRYGCF